MIERKIVEKQGETTKLTNNQKISAEGIDEVNLSENVFSNEKLSEKTKLNLQISDYIAELEKQGKIPYQGHTEIIDNQNSITNTAEQEKINQIYQKINEIYGNFGINVLISSENIREYLSKSRMNQFLLSNFNVEVLGIDDLLESLGKLGVELAKYPQGFLKDANLKNILLVGSIDGKKEKEDWLGNKVRVKLGGYHSLGEDYIMIVNDDMEEDLTFDRILHHEIFHALDGEFQQYEDEKWDEIPKKTSNGAIDLKSFVTDYAHTNAIEDRAETASFMRTDLENLLERSYENEALHKKVELLFNFFHRVDSRFNIDFWLNKVHRGSHPLDDYNQAFVLEDKSNGLATKEYEKQLDKKQKMKGKMAEKTEEEKKAESEYFDTVYHKAEKLLKKIKGKLEAEGLGHEVILEDGVIVLDSDFGFMINKVGAAEFGGFGNLEWLTGTGQLPISAGNDLKKDKNNKIGGKIDLKVKSHKENMDNLKKLENMVDLLGKDSD